MTNKRIGVLNFQHSKHNYGAVLQAAALEYILESEGHEVEHINYIPKSKRKNLRSIIKKLLTSFGILKLKQKNSEAFDRFREDFIKRSSRIETPSEFTNLAVNYELIVVGSDQVWRPSMSTQPEVYFLAYAPKEVSRVSYAASFGASEWEPDENSVITKVAKLEISKFKAISCRETSGVAICKSRFKVSANHVLDPLLQVDDNFFDKILERTKHSESKIVHYKLDEGKKFTSILKELEMKLGFSSKNLYQSDRSPSEYREVSQWVRDIIDSDIVISDSFHCICLGLRFSKDVVYLPNNARGQARLDDLFSYLGVKKEELQLESSSEVFRLIRQSDFMDNLEAKRKLSNLFIKNNINR